MIVSLSTWKHGFRPNEVCYNALKLGRSALDSVELGANFCESDLTCMSVGQGGLPDDLGYVTLDASIMDHEGNCGSVLFVQDYLNVASIARKVMEKTPHVMLAGTGAEKFAHDQGFYRTTLLTDKAQVLYEQWKQFPNKLQVRLRRKEEGEHEYVFEVIDSQGDKHELDRNGLTPMNESHDTIGVVGFDNEGKLAGACTTSGLAFKMHGRVGDSPVIGAGLYVDGKVAAAVATGNGELVLRACSTFHIVEMIRQGMELDKALDIAVERIGRDKHLNDDMQVGLMVIRADGEWSARALRPGFQFAAACSKKLNGINTLYDCDEKGFVLAK